MLIVNEILGTHKTTDPHSKRPLLPEKRDSSVSPQLSATLARPSCPVGSRSRSATTPLPTRGRTRPAQHPVEWRAGQTSEYDLGFDLPVPINPAYLFLKPTGQEQHPSTGMRSRICNCHPKTTPIKQAGATIAYHPGKIGRTTSQGSAQDAPTLDRWAPRFHEPHTSNLSQTEGHPYALTPEQASPALANKHPDRRETS